MRVLSPPPPDTGVVRQPVTSTTAREFLARLTDEQARFVEALATARVVLDDDDRQLASAATCQTRLLQQFLDAQRAILRRRAEVDAEVRRIERSAPPMTEVDHLADLLAVTASLSEERAATMDAQLRALLDDWWRSELDEATAVVDDATARAAMQRHLAGERDSSTDGRPSASAFDPWALTAPGEPGEPDDRRSDDQCALEELIASLLESLGGEAPTPEADGGRRATPWPSPQPAAVVVAASAPGSPAGRAPAQETFDRFWGDGSAPGASGLARRSLVHQLVPPMIVLVAVLAVALAWIG